MSSSLSWSDTDLTAPLQTIFSEHNDVEHGKLSTSDKVAPSWRSLSFERAHLPTGLTQASIEVGPFAPDSGPVEQASFLTSTDISFVSSDSGGEQNRDSQVSIFDKDEILSQYYEHSFAVHEDIPSSQIIGARSIVENFSHAESEGFSINSSTSSDISSQEHIVRSRLSSACLSDLRDIPNAKHLRSITPQTMTVDLVVGIISISQPRNVITRRAGRSVDLVEILVGDSTRSGFGINIWLPSLQDNQYTIYAGGHLRSSTLQLRPQDIVLAKTIALNSFNGKVYGQSLRRNMTTLDLLYRNVIDGNDERGIYRVKDLEDEALTDPRVFRVKRVKEWVMQFVSRAARPPALNYGIIPPMKREHLQALPSDTP